MDIRLSENIRKFRKNRKLTQEQLAEALGVTVGAVSKWELGSSVPDIGYIMEMADFFETSVDALLGYELQSGTLSATLDRLERCRLSKDYTAGIAEVDKALQKFPNSFPVTYRCAKLLALHSIEKRDFDLIERALALLRRSIDLFAQNTDPAITQFDIYTDISLCLLSSGRTEESLALLKEHNPGGIHDASIGLGYAADLHDAASAFPYLTQAFTSCLQTMIRTMVGFANAYCVQNRYREAYEACRWLYEFLFSLKKDKESVFCFDKFLALMASGCAFTAWKLEQTALAKEQLRTACHLACRYDAFPDTHLNGLRFCEDYEQPNAIYDDIGESALASVDSYLLENDPEDSGLYSLWKKICQETSQSADSSEPVTG